MKLALFVPCYVDQLRPDVALATLDVLESLGLRVEVPARQPCCGQPLANFGALQHTHQLTSHFATAFRGYDVVVCPSGSCTAQLRRDLMLQGLTATVLELSEFLIHRVGAEAIHGNFPYRVGLHASCHGLRELHLGTPSELVVSEAAADPTRVLLGQLAGLKFAEPERGDECCGFGGSFCVGEASTSVRMGSDRLRDFVGAGAEVITGTDISCLMHLESVAAADGLSLAFMHLAEVLAGRPVLRPATRRPLSRLAKERTAP